MLHLDFLEEDLREVYYLLLQQLFVEKMYHHLIHQLHHKNLD
jgi:hypothetical protein